MPKCAVWSCKNSSNNIRIKDGVSFFHYPRDPFLASQWWSVLSPVVAGSFKPTTAVVCSDHFHNDHKYMCKKRHRLARNAVPDASLLGPASTRSNTMLPQHDQFDDLESSDDENNMIVDVPEILRPPSESTVCRVCLMTEGRMKRVTEDNYEDAYKQVTGIKWNKEDKLPQHLCWECGHRLQSAARFKRKAVAAHNLLQDIRSDHNFLTLNDIKIIDRNYNQLVSNLTQKHFPPNQYLSDTTINNNKIFSKPDISKLEKRLKRNPVEKVLSANKIYTPENLATIAQRAQIQNDVKIEINAAKTNITVTYRNSTDENPEPEDLSLPTYKNLASNIDNSNWLDAYKKPNGDTRNLGTCKNVQSSTDTSNNLNLTNSNACLPTYENLESYRNKLKYPDSYKNLKQTCDSILATYLKQDSNTYKNTNGNSNYGNLETNDNSNIPTYKNLESNGDMPDLNIEESEETDVAPKIIDSKTSDKDIDKYDDMYDSDESDILVIDDHIKTEIKSEYVGAGDGMPIDELIDIYNNDGDGDGRLQELNDRFGDEATTKIDNGWGTQRKSECNSHSEKTTQDPIAELTRPKTTKSGEVRTVSSIHRRAYRKLNETLFTLTRVSEAEQIADIYKRQDTFRFKRYPFKCYLCFRSFKMRRYYDTHMQRHDASNGAYECPVCKARQKTPQAVKSHKYGQHSLRITCNKCHFLTMSRSVARRHEQWHAGTIYACPHCSDEFHQESTYNNHLRTQHVNAFACSICGFTFVTRKGLAVHRCKRHGDAELFPLLGPRCDACDLRFMSDEAYTRHLKLSSRHHPGSSPSNIGLRDAGN